MAGDDELSQNGEEEIQSQTPEQASSDRLFKLPLTRIKHIIKSDPDVSLASQEAVVSLAKAAVSLCSVFDQKHVARFMMFVIED